MSSRFVFGLLAGVAVGAALVYYASSQDKEELMDDLKDLADKTRDKISQKIHSKGPVEETAEELGI